MVNGQPCSAEMRHTQNSPIPLYNLLWALLKTFLKWIRLAITYYSAEYPYYYSRRFYFRFLPDSLKPAFSHYLPQQKPSLKIRDETKKWLIIYLIQFGQFSCDEITASLIHLNVKGITRKVVEKTFVENMIEFGHLPTHYLLRFNNKK